MYLRQLISMPIASNSTDSHVTCGSVVKLTSSEKPEYKLHSHDIKYGSGSGQQSVTAVKGQDADSHWAVLGPKGQPCTRGLAIECGATIRLLHTLTRKYLHSHLFKSPLSSQQEVSAFGNDEESDTGDHWIVYCRGKYWKKQDDVRLKHKDTDAWLSLSGNVYRRPITGQLEVVAKFNSDSSSYWQSHEGVYVLPAAGQASSEQSHDEL